MKKSTFENFQDNIAIPYHDKGFETRPKSTNKRFKKNSGFELTPSLYHPIVINWSEMGRGFGEYIFYQKDGKIYCLNESDSKETVKRMLCKMVDQSEFIDN